MPIVVQERIRIGISACNAGARVRWNRAGWDRIASLNREMTGYVWTPVCPEVAAGMGVPRDPVRLTGGNGIDVWTGASEMKDRSGRNWTNEIRDGCRDCLQTLKRAQVEAFVFMEGSPSCGVYRTTHKDNRLGQPPGVFGALLLEENLFLIPAADLESPLKWWDWRRRLHAFCWLRSLEVADKESLYTAWHHLKFLCQEVDQTEAQSIGARLAALPERPSPQAAGEWRSATLRLLRRPTTLRRITSVVEKHFAHYRKHFNSATGELKSPTADLSKSRYVDELLAMEKRALAEGFDFEAAPVLFREKR